MEAGRTTAPSRPRAVATKYVYDFVEGSREMRELLGGKGANVAEMSRVLGPERVPAGFTITTEACVAYLAAGEEPEGLAEQVAEALDRLERSAGKRLGDPGDPLLVSVRSGARESMPGMLDTVLNLGLHDGCVDGLAAMSANQWFAWDSYRRFVQMFGNVVRGIPGDLYERELTAARSAAGVELDTDLPVQALRDLVDRFKAAFSQRTGEEFPQDPGEQLRQAVRAVFDSWSGDRAVQYRRINRIPDDWGTAVNVQRMVFGNRGQTSGSGVAFTRDEVTGAPRPSGDFLVNAQGEDVVSGVRNTREIDELRDLMPEVYAELMEILGILERHYRDMQDVEFTIEDGRLYMLQTRSAKRPAQAAVRFAVDAVREGLLGRDEALLTIDAASLDALLHPTFDPAAEYRVLARGVAASPGAAKGTIVFSAPDAVAAAEEGRDVVLVRPFTEADDVAGFAAARGILTSEGGKASHAALVARGMGRPCVCGASELAIDLSARSMTAGDTVLREGDPIAINGTTGDITVDDVALVEPEMGDEFATVLAWADELRRLGVRTNADTPDDARRARQFGAEGIGLCRTEHMFFNPERDALVKRMFLSAEGWRRLRADAQQAADDERPDAQRRFDQADAAFWRELSELQALQRADFESILEAMDGRPVTIRLLDPPLHEFLPVEHFRAEVERLEQEGGDDRLETARRELALVESLSEANPMLGTRGARLGILYPPIYEMQVRAILEAAIATARGGDPPRVEIMLPLIAYETELRLLREFMVRVAEETMEAAGERVEYSVGTMIELPRACLVAARIAHYADFFSFGTNDLTQTALGFSRDDIEARILARYIDRKILDRSPFETIDEPGVGALVRLAARSGREARPDLKLGICGEHGGDPDSIEFFERVGLDYVSCSPYRVPVARVAAAQAAVRAA
ncbi:MAG TPA: pyruvate, phosphate dikinase [Solirubrobacteraceae bacterium]|nr:pyruvate, phosphate dikinase [Solirubrobacteraceae bacterium]